MGELRKIPGIGPNIEADLEAIGIHSIADLRGKDPEELYRRECRLKGFEEDRCALYVWRTAVYYAENPVREAEKLKWWYWKDTPYPPPKEGETNESAK